MARRERGASERADVRKLSNNQESELGTGAARYFAQDWGGSDSPVFFASEEVRREAWRLHGQRI
ncbi:MAG TPA: hypothetical protein VMN39_09290, partial [Longimicrobiaceae bacterium]|nr:hypothetical protein [Longimicrobiaceae bacterium]